MSRARNSVLEVKEANKQVEYRFCRFCRYYDNSTEREFHRKIGKQNDKGEREEIVEIRAVCRNKNAKSFGHLVMAEYFYP